MMASNFETLVVSFFPISLSLCNGLNSPSEPGTETKQLDQHDREESDNDCWHAQHARLRSRVAKSPYKQHGLGEG